MRKIIFILFTFILTLSNIKAQTYENDTIETLILDFNSKKIIIGTFADGLPETNVINGSGKFKKVVKNICESYADNKSDKSQNNKVAEKENAECRDIYENICNLVFVDYSTEQLGVISQILDIEYENRKELIKKLEKLCQ